MARSFEYPLGGDGRPSGRLDDDIQDVLIPASEIQAELDRMAAEIERDYAGEELLLVGVLKGAVLLIADLLRRLSLPVSVDFMECSSYGSSTKSSGVVRILKDLATEIGDKHVLLVEDIIDSGLTLDYLLRNLRSREPKSLEVLTLLTKPSHQRIEIPLRYVGFEVPDVFVVGYGLDYAEHYRNLPYIGTLKPEVYAE